ncbi:uncharacterized protein LOC127848444 [Dreissena polymorpha]|uniref:uncharacterized protein LOC127848444 n=1 Tax=Dreissena polymorpha TaxID=45954 RepID=UPI00226473E4|nr:uncharacterized protein LOC127848444 [Dreissena polymorpha]
MDAKAGVLMSIIACVMNIIGLAIPYWLEFSRSEAGQSVSYNYGLWSMCAHEESFYKCAVFKSETVPDVFLQARYIEIAASILMFFSIIWGVVQTVLHTPKALFTKPSGVVCFIAGILALVGCIVFAANSFIKTMMTGYHYHAGFAMCIIAGVLSLVSGILYMLAKKGTQHT